MLDTKNTDTNKERLNELLNFFLFNLTKKTFFCHSIRAVLSFDATMNASEETSCSFVVVAAVVVDVVVVDVDAEVEVDARHFRAVACGDAIDPRHRASSRVRSLRSLRGSGTPEQEGC